MDEFPFSGDACLRERVAAALHRVIDPEMALDIVALGLVYGVRVEAREAHVDITMTSAACPVTELIVEETTEEMQRALGDGYRVFVNVVWDPPWEPERMSAAARAAMGWE